MAVRVARPPDKVRGRIRLVHISFLTIALVAAAPFWYASQNLHQTTIETFRDDTQFWESSASSKNTLARKISGRSDENESAVWRKLFAEKYQAFTTVVPSGYQHIFAVESMERFHTNKETYSSDCLASASYWTRQACELLWEWRDFQKSNSSTRRQIPYVLKVDPAGPPNMPADSFPSIALVMQGSTDRLGKLLVQIQQWDGPISVALYVTEKSHLDQAIHFVKIHLSNLKQVTFHFLFEKKLQDEDNFYPHNYLRNCALNYTDTDYILYVDMDFCPGGPSNSTVYRGLRKLIHESSEVSLALQRKTLLVLPAFEVLQVEKFEVFQNTTYPPNPLMPRDKHTLTRLVQDLHLVQPFHLDRFMPGHSASNFPAWYAHQESSDIYNISYEEFFEPYTLTLRKGLHYFWTGFRGFGSNKLSWYEEAHRRGYQFAVLRDYFVFHVGMEGSSNVKMNGGLLKRERAKFAKYLDHTRGKLQTPLNRTTYKIYYREKVARKKQKKAEEDALRRGISNP